MSHVADVELALSDLDALEAACEKLGLELRRGQTTHAWYGRWMNDWSTGDAAVLKGRDPKTFGHCTHAIRRKDHRDGDYEIGLCERADGTGYDAVYDTWGSGGARITELAGKRLDKLAEVYGAEVAIRKMKKRGYRVSKYELDAEGHTHLVMTKA